MSREAFNQLWATAPSNPGNDASFSVPRDSIWGTGWEGGADKDAPKAGEQNWWQNRVDFALQGLERNGAMAWDVDAIYAAGAPAYASDSNYYESLAPSNTGHDPVATTGYWRLIGPSLYGIIPVGAVLSVAHSGVPDIGWIKCNGAVLNRASYQRLFDKIGTTHNTGGESSLQFRLPDYRGEFLRGFDDSRGVDANRVFGSAQSGAMEAHSHYLPTSTQAAGAAYGISDSAFTQCSVNYFPATSSATKATTYPNPSFGENPTDVGPIGTFSTETRPRNKAVNFWIKY